MKWMYRIFFTLLLSASIPPLQAWELSVQTGEGDAQPMIWVGSQQAQGALDVYLLWLDLDETPQRQLQSWHSQQGWQSGAHPAFDQALKIVEFKSFAITPMRPECAAEHRCFLAVLGIEPGQLWSDLEAWTDAAVLPLTVPAALERLPGQTWFLTPNDLTDRGTVFTSGGVDAAMDGVSAEAPAPAAATDGGNKDSSDTTSTEKPDIFRLLDQKTLLYVNGQAERLQMIDVSDLSQPRLATSMNLEASPKELYVLNDLYILLQNQYASASSLLSVVKQTLEGQLEQVDQYPIPGILYESRRRNERIYSVARTINDSGECCADYASLDINVVQIDALGHLDSIGNHRIRGYDPKIAVFPDHLVIANRSPESWPDSWVQVYALNDSRDPLVDLGVVQVSGYIPSEFHVDVRDQQLRVVYGPESREAGSSLGIYDLSTPGLPLLGEVSHIAPGEALFATRFHQDKAYVVTFERTDPLWVIGLSNPRQPEILGELIVPGWSEKMFFHNDRLFAVGIDDQPAEGETERWYRRVAMSLFDVSDPTQPGLLDRFTPLTGAVNYSYSPATDDERALLLNWDRQFAALPINSWQSQARSTLQMVDFSQDKFLDLGLLELDVPAQRSLILRDNILGVMADQRFITAQWSDSEKPQVLGELELAYNLGWLDKQDEHLWTAGYGQNGYRYIYRYATDALDEPAQSWTLAQGFYEVAHTDAQALFYQRSPLTVQRFDYATQSVSALHVLEASTADTDKTMTDRHLVSYHGAWYQNSSLFINQDRFYLGEIREVQFDRRPQLTNKDEEGMVTEAPFVEPAYVFTQEWRLRSWRWENGKAVEQKPLSIPGRPLALTEDQHLITVENTPQGSRLQWVALRGAWVQIMQSLALDCSINTLYQQVDGYYASCTNTPDYSPMYLADDSATPNTAQTRLLHLVVDGGLRIAREWTLEGQRELLAVHQDTVLLGPNYNYYYYGYPMEPSIMVDDALARKSIMAPGIMPPNAQSQCEVFVLNPELQSQLKLDTCPASQNTVLLPGHMYTTQGFAGIKQTSW